MRLDYMMCSDHVIVDMNTNRVSLINIVDEVNSLQFPALIPQFSTIVSMLKEDGDGEYREGALVIKLNGTMIARGPIVLNFNESLKSRAMSSINGLLITTPGKLEVILEIDGAEFASFSVPVQAAGPQFANQIGG